jgi:transposase
VQLGRPCLLILSTVPSSPKVVADDTTLPVLDPGRGRTKTGRLWCYATDNRPWSGPGHPAAAYVYSEDRKGEHPASHLKGFQGLLQVDGYAGFGQVVTAAANQPPQLAFCWAHARRKFYDVPRRIGRGYRLRSRPLVEALQGWLSEQLGRLSGRSKLAQAIRYAFNHWEGLIQFLDDGRLELDTTLSSAPCAPSPSGGGIPCLPEPIAADITGRSSRR